MPRWWLSGTVTKTRCRHVCSHPFVLFLSGQGPLQCRTCGASGTVDGPAAARPAHLYRRRFLRQRFPGGRVTSMHACFGTPPHASMNDCRQAHSAFSWFEHSFAFFTVGFCFILSSLKESKERTSQSSTCVWMRLARTSHARLCVFLLAIECQGTCVRARACGCVSV